MTTSRKKLKGYTLLVVLTLFYFSYSVSGLTIDGPIERTEISEGVVIGNDITNSTFSNTTNYWGPYIYTLFANYPNWNTAFGWGDHSTQGYLTAGYNPFNQSLNTTDAVEFKNITSESINLDNTLGTNFPIQITGHLPATRGISEIVTANATISVPMWMDVELIAGHSTNSALMYPYYGKSRINSDTTTGTLASKGIVLDVGATATQSQGTRDYTGVDVGITQTQVAGASTVKRTGLDIIMNYFVATAPINSTTWGIKLTNTDDSFIVGAYNSTKYGIYLDGWGKGSYDNLTYAIYSNEGDSYFNGNINATNFYGTLNYSWITNHPTIPSPTWTQGTPNWLYNTTALFFNETFLNLTIEGLDSDTNESWNVFDQILNKTSNSTFDNINISTNITNKNLNIWQNSTTINIFGGGKNICLGNCS